MNDKLIEAMARSICEVEEDIGSCDVLHFGNPAWKAYKPNVHVALTAIKEAGFVIVPDDELHAPLDENCFEIEDALKSEDIWVWGPDGERFERMFEVVMNIRRNGTYSDENMENAEAAMIEASQ